MSPSIKDQERARRGTRNEFLKLVDQSRCNLHTNWKDLVKNQVFKGEFSVFLMNESENAE